MTVTAKHLFGSLFGRGACSIANNPDFKEDSVREVIILPILNALGYKNKFCSLMASITTFALKAALNFLLFFIQQI
ncbi:MAG: hypothetical protein LBH32_09665 [Dysgonamonadaceae bacterium]|jgi:hypothetical protein|nr:hypothetical protein [Dysgonamonadaceae bacterium]